MTNQKMIVGIGRAFTDIIATVDDAFIEKFHLEKGIGLRVPPEKMQEIISELDDPVYMAGGSIANTIAGLRELGHDVAFIGKTGDDEAGGVFREEFERIDVPFPNPPVPDATSGACICLNTIDGERSFAFNAGVCEDLSPEDLNLPLFDAAGMMVLQVMMMETAVCFQAAEEVIPRLPSHVKKVMCLHDLRDKSKITGLVLQHVDILIGSRIEFENIIDVSTEQELAAYAKNKNLIMAMTCGAEGAMVATPEEVHHVAPVPPLKIVDSVGAGDFFAAGFLYGISNDWPLKKSGDLGAKYASLIIEQVGARANEETVQKIRDYMAS